VPAAAINEQRVEWVDCCKGICIVLVVYGHVAGGLEASGILSTKSTIAGLREWVYLFHIPAFFYLSGLLSGYLAQKSAERPFVEFLRGRLRVLAYPYFLWTAIIFLSQLAMGPLVNTPPSLHRVLRSLWEPYGVGLWFLYSLFLISVLFNCLRRWRVPTHFILLIALIVYVVANENGFLFWTILNASMGYVIFFIIGGCYPGIIAAPFKDARWHLLLAGGVGMLTVMTMLQWAPWNPAGMTGLLKALLGICGVVCVAMAMARKGATAGAPWAVLGTYSLEIYLAHPLWGTASRAVLLKLGVHAPVVFVVCGVLLGVFGSLATALLCKRFDFPYLFRWPARRRPRLQVAPSS
jgi:fucose 4-O-acetylase-like acetyltransferase